MRSADSIAHELVMAAFAELSRMIDQQQQHDRNAAENPVQR